MLPNHCRAWLYRILIFIPLLFVGCGGSSSGDGGEPPPTGDQTDIDNGDTANGNGDEEPTSPTDGPASIFNAAEDLAYPERYDGETDWAAPSAAGTQHVRLVDSAQLGNAVMVVPYVISNDVLQAQGHAPDDLLAFLDVRDCTTGEGRSAQAPSQSVSDCVQVSNADNSVIDFGGQIDWHTSDGTPFDYVIELTSVDLFWRDEVFLLSGAIGLDAAMDNLHIAVDLTHEATETTYRYWVVHNYSLSTEQPQIDAISFHPDLGAILQLGESAYLETSECVGGGFESNGALLLSGNSAEDASAQFYYANVACDVVTFEHVMSRAANDEPVAPRLFAAYASLGMDFGVAVENWARTSGHQLGGTSDSQLLEPEAVDVALLGTNRDGDHWTQYEIALSYDLSDLPQEVVNGGLLAARWHSHQIAGEGHQNNIVRAVMTEWEGEPADSTFVGNDTQGYEVVEIMGGGMEQPWWAFDASEMIATALAQGRTHLQVVITSSYIIEPEQGELAKSFCLETGNNCREPLIPAISLAYHSDLPADDEPDAVTGFTLTPEPIKTLAFTWNGGSGATEYSLLEQPDPEVDYQQVATIVGGETAYDHEVYLPKRLTARYKLEACTSGGCVESEELAVDSDELAVAVGFVKPSNNIEEMEFGTDVAFSADGQVMAVSALQGEGDVRGSVIVFERDANDEWAELAHFWPDDPTESISFGRALALSADGSTIAVGANGGSNHEGRAYVFERMGNTWVEQASFTTNADLDGDQENDWFSTGIAIAGDGDTLAVSANHSFTEESVYIYNRSGDNWSKVQRLTADDGRENDNFGENLAMSVDGSMLLVGASMQPYGSPGPDPDENSGAVYVFTHNGSWSLAQQLKPSDVELGDRFGTSISLAHDGLTLAVGATGDDEEGTNSGAVYLYNRGDSSSAWQFAQKVKADPILAHVQVGYAVALSGDGNHLAIGSRNDSSAAEWIGGDPEESGVGNNGAVHLFEHDGEQWQYHSFVKPPYNPQTSIYFGESLALTSDGETLAITARHHNSSASGIGGDQEDSSGYRDGALFLY
ncbi:FG-GAP repeat protein [Marinimicrobium sp. ABcell2]|uniref:FG-GAP repeat protein n=1 Tax=Marinimicrobium sp. ABcell2 TaxID=3069751 RepID=UPI0027AE007B|nr:FG-GAP repeat protein [Marinimicrobium sp. ABcell2]MDQ2077819.1 FG-GAP repeat protein [Marinimicrobium sp. ABcell2]